MAHHDHSHCGETSCDHSHDHGVPDGGGEDFNGFLQETHPCCQKDAESKARALKVRAALDKVDPSQVAERARKAAFSSGMTGVQDYRRGGQDYPALKDLRAIASKGSHGIRDGVGPVGVGRVGPEEEVGGNDEDKDSDESDDEDDLDYLLDDPEIASMAQARVEAMHADAARLQSLRDLGFGVHIEVLELEVEAASKGQFRGAGVVLHLYDADSRLGASLDLLLEEKAGSYLGTRFIRCLLNPESGVASRMRIQRVPALACYKGGVRVAYTEQLSEFGDADGVDPGAINRWLAASGALEFDPPDLKALREDSGTWAAGAADDGEDDGDESAEVRYDCGLEGCHKTFKHDHFLAAGGGGLPTGFGEGI